MRTITLGRLINFACQTDKPMLFKTAGADRCVRRTRADAVKHFFLFIRLERYIYIRLSMVTMVKMTNTMTFMVQIGINDIE